MGSKRAGNMKKLYFITYRTKDLLELKDENSNFLSTKINDFFKNVSIFNKFDKENGLIVEKEQAKDILVYYEPVGECGVYITDFDYIHAWTEFLNGKKEYETITIILNKNNNIGPWQSYEILCCLTKHQRKIYWITPNFFADYIKDKSCLENDKIEEFFQGILSEKNLKINNHQLAELTPKE